ncbi:type II secretion system F family protein [Nocardioides sp. GY 10127]|uniref:type II secretion system F family protein n=1 Tax=Nocardioides sp. GY 10127 TaxID=2569762 RepID=UPI0010A87CAC|nr:type II secretion system F family protein [Nocardioides sp. GY 10127]TIC80939.1 type II secretion system F family protein [Nocardioides sp. GY 10127]
MTLVLALLLVLLALGLLAVASRPAPETGVGRSLAVIEALSSAPAELRAEQDSERSFGERVVRPLRARWLRLARRFTGADTAERLRHRLDLAGNPAGHTPEKMVGAKLALAAAGAVLAPLAAWVLGLGPTVVLLAVLAGAAVGFLAPDLYLYQRGYDRSERLRRDLPDALDLLAISVEAGLGFDAALQQVASRTTGPVAEELSRLLREMQLGSSRSEALRALAERTDVVELQQFVGAMVQADGFGIPIAQVLRVQMGEMRIKRRQRAEAKAQQVPVKITIPLVLCILPALFVVIMGPAVLSVLDTF